MNTKITVLSENSVLKSGNLLGEHGFCALVERGDEKVLFDTGRGYALVHNARFIGIDLGSIRKVVLSHGHSDHTGGLVELFQDMRPREVFAHPDVFHSRFHELPDGSRRPIGMPFSRAFLEGLGARFILSKGPREVCPGVTLTGEVPRVTPFETGDPTLVLGSEHGGGKDYLLDDLSLIVEGESGLVVLLGCAHAGMVNILRHARKLKPDRPIRVVMGGTHLGMSSEEQMVETIEAMKDMGVEKVGASHCTGLEGSARLMAALGDHFFFAGAGAIVEV